MTTRKELEKHMAKLQAEVDAMKEQIKSIPEGTDAWPQKGDKIPYQGTYNRKLSSELENVKLGSVGVGEMDNEQMNNLPDITSASDFIRVPRRDFEKFKNVHDLLINFAAYVTGRPVDVLLPIDLKMYHESLIARRKQKKKITDECAEFPVQAYIDEIERLEAKIEDLEAGGCMRDQVASMQNVVDAAVSYYYANHHLEDSLENYYEPLVKATCQYLIRNHKED